MGFVSCYTNINILEKQETENVQAGCLFFVFPLFWTYNHIYQKPTIQKLNFEFSCAIGSVIGVTYIAIHLSPRSLRNQKDLLYIKIKYSIRFVTEKKLI